MRGGAAAARRLSAAALAAALLWPASPLQAQTAARPNFPAPPLPTTPVGRSLSNAYHSIVRAEVSNPAAAQQASYKYVQALQRARAGDVSGALSASGQAQAQVLTGVPRAQPVQPLTAPQVPTTVLAPTGVTPPENGVPIVDSGGEVLTADLLVARNEIDLAQSITHKPLGAAQLHYRKALDAYESGNAARSRVEARSAFDAAADVLSTVK